MKQLKLQVFSALLLIFVGLSFLANDYIVEKRENTFSSMNLELTELLTEAKKETPATSETTPTSANTETPNEEIGNNTTEEDNNQPQATTTDYETYVGILDIPKIGFSKGFYKKESSLNNVKINIKILTDSSYPDEDKGNVIIIGHSGNYSNSYFGNLYQLQLEDTATITYENKKYTYKIVNIYTDKKDGTVTVYRDETKTCLTLITCTKDDETTQTIYILELVSVE